MYCIKCGVKLADGTKKCPLCGANLNFPEYENITPEAKYPKSEFANKEINRHGIVFVLTFLFLIPALLVAVCDLSLNHAVTWSGYAFGAIALVYVIAILPMWFKMPNPVIFLPIDFAALLLYLLYIDLFTDGGWFLGFAFPTVGALAVIFCAVVTLLKYIHHGRLYIFGGASIALGAALMLAEFLMDSTFDMMGRRMWSIYPLTVFALIGIMLIVIAIVKPFKESLKRKFFL